MTLPHLMNCSHSGEGWCLDCVKELHDQWEMTAEREAKLREALRSCLSCMKIQERREDGSFHLSVEAFRPMWDEAKARAVAALESKGGG